MKFTEEQYQKIIKATKDIVNSGDMRLMGTNASISVHSKLYATDKVNQLPFRELENEIMAIVNPLTREWAHDKFVEKEKKYYWTSKTLDNSGAHYQLYRTRDGMLMNVFVPAKSKIYYEKGVDYAIAESEVKLWGYNPEMFDKEEA